MHDSAGRAEAPPVRYLFGFTGKGGEYFGIWIVNILLTIVTLGIYSAWAKVRTQRYIYGNTWIDGHNFEYHAKPRQLLLGRILAILIVAGIMASHTFLKPMEYSILQAGVGILFMFLAPWLVVRSLKFNARMTSHRNVRFDFSGAYEEALRLFWVLPIMTIITLTTAYPIAQRELYSFIAGNFRYGNRPFISSTSLKKNVCLLRDCRIDFF